MKNWASHLSRRNLLTWVKVSVLLGFAAAYILAFLSLYPSMGKEIGAAVVIPVTAAGWLCGLRGGSVGGLLAVVVTTLLLNLAGFEPGGWAVLAHAEAVPGTVAAVVIGMMVGGLSDLAECLQKEIIQRKRANAKVLEINQKLEWRVTERTEALRHSEQQLKAILSSLKEVVWSVSLKDRALVYVSPSFEKMYGRPTSEFLENPKKTWLEVVHPEDRERAAGFTKAILERGSLHMEYRIIRPDGEVRWIYNRASLIRDSNGSPIRFDGITIDITQRKLVEIRMLQAEEELRNLSQKLISLQDEERRRVSLELHDDLSQRVALVTLGMEKLSLEETPESSATVQLRELTGQIKELSTEMHRLSHQLHPSALEHLGLVSTARSLCKEISQVSGIQIDFNELCVPRSIPKDVSLCLYRVLQESLRDIANHSGAQEAHVKFTGTVDSVQLCVCDPGVLQDYGELSLASMRERVHQVGGEFSIEPQVSGGTQLKVSIPFTYRSLES